MRLPVPWAMAWIFCSAVDAAAAAQTLQLAECRLENPNASGSVAARCGTYRVRENRDDARSKELQVHVAVIPALRLKPAADPLFIISGGPGQAASDFYLGLAAVFARVRRDRDIVLVDQRGTGRSNRLDCPLPDDSEVTLLDSQKLRSLVHDCLAALPGDPRYYTTSIAVRDLDDVRAALGYQSLNLYGVSYGTRVAQHYMRRYPGRVRAAVLDGLVPAELALGPQTALEAQRALDAVFQRCAEDQACARQFPDVRGQFAALQVRLQAEPVSVPILHPITGRLTSETLDGARLDAAVRLLSYSDETMSILPLLIHEAQTLREPHSLVAQYLMIERSTTMQLAAGMHFAVVCSEDAPRWDAQNVSDEMLAATYLGPVFMSSMRAICADWPRGPVDEDFGRPLQSAVPTLLLSGSNDPATPQHYAEQIMKGLSNARHLVAPGQGHGQMGNGCIARLAAEFIASASAAALDVACVGDIEPAPFMLSRSAPSP